jgi:predicted nucleic acid-binding protein
MSAVDIFVDTNILLYAHDLDADDKHVTALQLIRQFWERREIPSLSIQVLQEMHVTLMRKGVPVETSADTVRQYLSWQVIHNTTNTCAAPSMFNHASPSRFGMQPLSRLRSRQARASCGLKTSMPVTTFGGS